MTSKNIFQLRDDAAAYMRMRRRDPEFKLVEYIRNLRRRAINKFEVINHYTIGKLVCACCGESYYFLTVDHIDGLGEQHRREIGAQGSNSIYIYLRRGNFPPGFQILCYNCNFARHYFGGICPHQFWDKIQKITIPYEKTPPLCSIK